MAKIIWTSSAEDDLKMINDHISIDSEFHAGKFIDKIYKRPSVLKTHTHIGKVVPEFNKPSIRELIEYPYLIIYKIKNENTISIVRVYHSARLLKKP